MAAHDLHHSGAVRRAARGGFHRFGNFSKKLWADGRRRHHAEHLRILSRVVIETVNRATRDAQRLSRTYVDLLAAHGPGQYAADAIDCFLIMVVAMRWADQPLQSGNNDLKDREAAGGG